MSAGQLNYTWRIAGTSVVILLLLTLALYQHTIHYLTGLWNQLDVGEYAHGYLVLAISGYLVLNNRQKLFALTPCMEYRALPGIIAASVIWLVAALVDVEMLQTVGLLLLVLSIVWLVLGNDVIRVLAFPILFIGFAIPIWFPLSPVLQNLAADAVFWAIRFLDVPAFRQENMIVLPAGALSIEEACSGLRYLLAALTLGTLYAYMNYSSLRSRVIVVLISAGTAVLVNILRVFIVVYLAYTTEMQHPLVEDHLSLGWYLFGGLVAILLLIDAYLHRKAPIAEPVVSQPVDETSRSMICKNSVPHSFMLVMAGGLILSVAPVLVYQVNHHSDNEVAHAAPDLPSGADGWLRSDAGNEGWMPVYHGATNRKQSYRKDNNEIILYMGYYASQDQGRELINDLNQINNRKVWRAVYPVAHTQDAGERQVLEQVLNNGSNNKRLVWYWYNVAGRITTNKYEAKLMQVIGLLTGKPWAFVVAVTTQTDDDTEDSRMLLRSFITSIEKPMNNELERLAVSQ